MLRFNPAMQMSAAEAGRSSGVLCTSFFFLLEISLDLYRDGKFLFLMSQGDPLHHVDIHIARTSTQVAGGSGITREGDGR